jgi:hypothetical protein
MSRILQLELPAKKVLGSPAARSGRSCPFSHMTSNLLIWQGATSTEMQPGLKVYGMMSGNTYTRYLSNTTGLGNAVETWENGALQRSSRDGCELHFGKVAVLIPLYIGRAIPKGTGADHSIVEPDAENETAQAKRKWKKHGPYNKRDNNESNLNENGMLKALREGTQTEAQLSALHLILEYGTQDQQKKAMKQIDAVAYGRKRKKKKTTRTTDSSVDELDEVSSADSTTTEESSSSTD